MQLSEEEKTELEELASLYFTRKECEVIMFGADDPYLKGRLKREASVRKTAFEMAEAGSSPAMEYVMKLAQKTMMREIEEKWQEEK